MIYTNTSDVVSGENIESGDLIYIDKGTAYKATTGARIDGGVTTDSTAIRILSGMIIIFRAGTDLKLNQWVRIRKKDGTVVSQKHPTRNTIGLVFADCKKDEMAMITTNGVLEYTAIND